MVYGHTKAKSQIQIPLPKKYLGVGYKGLVFCRNNGWIMKKHRQGTHSTKMGADIPAENIPNPSKDFSPKCLPKPKSSKILKKQDRRYSDPRALNG